MRPCPMPALRLCPRLARTGLAALCLAGAALAAPGAPPASGSASPNVYTAGGEVRPGRPITGDLAAAGGRIVLEQPVGGDAALAGGSVDVRAPVGDDLRVVGGSISIENKVGKDVFAAGGDVVLRRGFSVGGAADLNAANVVVQGRIDGSLHARAQKIVVDGEVRGPASLVAEHIELGPTARVLGPLTYASPAEIRRAEGAIVEGPVTRQTAPGAGSARAGQASGGGFSAPGAILLYIALFAFSSIFVLLLPRFAEGAAARLRQSPWAALGIGVASVVAMPMLTVLLFITVLGIPLGLALMSVYPVLVLAGFVVGVLCLKQLLAGLLRMPAPADRAGARLGQLALALLLVLLLGLVPVAGAVAIGLASLAGLGAGVLQLRAPRGVGGNTVASSSDLPLPGHDVFPA